MKKSTIITIIVTALIISISLIIIQTNKANSIERQARLDREQKIEQERLDRKTKECEVALEGLKKQYSNVVGIEYNDFFMECYVSFLDVDTKQIQKSALSDIGTY